MLGQSVSLVSHFIVRCRVHPEHVVQSLSTMHASAENMSDERPLQSRWGYVALLFLAAGVVVSAFTLASPYSYWLDELYSVTASNENFSSLHRIILHDLHPPLYQLLLKGWTTISVQRKEQRLRLYFLVAGSFCSAEKQKLLYHLP